MSKNFMYLCLLVLLKEVSSMLVHVVVYMLLKCVGLHFGVCMSIY